MNVAVTKGGCAEGHAGCASVMKINKNLRVYI